MVSDSNTLVKEATPFADPSDLYVCAGMYFQGITVPVDKEKAVRLYRMSVEKGCTEDRVRLGAIYMTGDGAEKGLVKSFRWFKFTVDKEGPDDMYFLALRCSRGWGTEKSSSETVRLCYFAADAGCTGAMVEITKWYHNESNLLAKNIDLCLAWFHRAADKEYSDTLYGLGCMYRFREGVEKDVKSGKVLLEYVKRYGNPDAREALKKGLGYKPE